MNSSHETHILTTIDVISSVLTTKEREWTKLDRMGWCKNENTRKRRFHSIKEMISTKIKDKNPSL